MLGPDERRLWDRVAAGATPLSGKDRNAEEPDVDLSGIDLPRTLSSEPETGQGARQDKAVPLAPTPGHDIQHRTKPRDKGVTVRSLAPEVGPVGRPEAGLDRRTSDRLRKGTREPDSRIDLHGMTAERAHRACLTFLSDALSRGQRVVLVITGKGGRRDNDDIMAPARGVLRESLPNWLRVSALGPSIVGIYQAHQKHGGTGAFYVYLKRRR